MSFVSWALIKKQVRWPVILTSVISVAYFGFFRQGCMCSIGAIQNVALWIGSPTYNIPLNILLLFLLPIVFALLFGRVFCAGVCPFGALQELLHFKTYKLPKIVTRILSFFPWFYLVFSVVHAATNSAFIICHYDPFIGIFRLGGELPFLILGIVLLVISIFTGRPYCRFICPYGVILGLVSRISFWKIKVTKQECIKCKLCHKACPVDAIQPPSKVKGAECVGCGRCFNSCPKNNATKGIFSK